MLIPAWPITAAFWCWPLQASWLWWWWCRPSRLWSACTVWSRALQRHQRQKKLRLRYIQN